MARLAFVLFFLLATAQARASAQGIVTVSTADQPESGQPRFCGGACSGIIQYIKTPVNALRVLSFKLYVTARGVLGEPIPLPDYSIGFARVPNWDSVRGNYIDLNCECYYGAMGRYSWDGGSSNGLHSAGGQVGEGWLESRGAIRDPILGPNSFIPFVSDELVAGEWLAFWVYAYLPYGAMAGVPVGNAVDGWYNIDTGGGGASLATTGVDLRFEAKFVTVPEPGTLPIVATGLVLLVAVARRRRTTV